MITTDQLKAILPHCKEPEQWANLLSEECAEWGLVTKTQIAGFIAQTGHESSHFNTLEENLNYSAERLDVVFPKYFKTVDPKQYHRNPEKIANRVYASRIGNGDEASGDGYKFRGRGLIQCTGRANYARCSEQLFGDDDVLLDSPELLLLPEHALGSALWYWKVNNLKDISDINIMTKKVNGGLIGIEDRKAIYTRALKVLS